MMRGAAHHLRKKGTGTVHRAGSRWQAKAPDAEGRRVYIGRFDTIREAERAIAAFIEGQKAG